MAVATIINTHLDNFKDGMAQLVDINLKRVIGNNIRKLRNCFNLANDANISGGLFTLRIATGKPEVNIVIIDRGHGTAMTPRQVITDPVVAVWMAKIRSFRDDARFIHHEI